MPCTLLALTSQTRDPARAARFWAELLQREVVEEDRGLLLPGSATQVGLRFVAGEVEMTRPNRVHLHLTSTQPSDQQQTVATALALGAEHLDVGQRPEEGHVVLVDPAGYEFCVIEAHNAYLAGCGFLGELACEGSREVGLFWAEALGWPLVWDQDQETAVQSPQGGTKVAWGGPPLPPQPVPCRQRLELVLDEGELDAEVERLVGLGATRLRTRPDGAVVLVDPDGTEFLLTLG